MCIRDRLGVKGVELGFALGKLGQFGAAHGRKVCGVAEQNRPLVALPFTELDIGSTMALEEIAQDKHFFRNNNPVLRHTILRRRDVLEDMGSLAKVAVDVHPDPTAPRGTYPGPALDGLGSITKLPYNTPYKTTQEIQKKKAFIKRTRAGSFSEF